MAKQEIRWTSSKRGKVHHAYAGARCIGFIVRENGPLGDTFHATHIPERGPTKHVGGCGGGDKGDALARAKELLIITAGGKV